MKELISEDRIARRVKSIARKINKDYKGKQPVFIGVLNGAFILLSDLVREITVDCEIDFMKLSSYGDAKISSGNVTLLKELDFEVKGRDVIVVEDIIDTGLSASFIRDLVLKEKPSSLRFVTLLYKKDLCKIDFEIDYIGFKIGNEFVIGYGLDHAQKYRNLKAIYVLKG